MGASNQKKKDSLGRKNLLGCGRKSKSIGFRAPDELRAKLEYFATLVPEGSGAEGEKSRICRVALEKHLKRLTLKLDKRSRSALKRAVESYVASTGDN